MKKLQTFFTTRLLGVLICMPLCLTSSAQGFPTDGSDWHGPNGTWAGDTIIFTPSFPIGNGNNQAPSLSNITVIYVHGYMVITTPLNTRYSYAIYDEEQAIMLRGEACATTTSPTLLDLHHLPYGRYTLLLYINNECLEGEFEK